MSRTLLSARWRRSSDLKNPEGLTTMLMPDALVLKCGYTPPELKKMADAAGIPGFSINALQMLEGAYNAFCWACSADPGGFLFVPDEQKRGQLKHILKLGAEKASRDEIAHALHELDGPTSQKLGKVRAGHPRFPNAVRRELKKI